MPSSLLLISLVIHLCLHACTARPLMVLDSVAQVQGLNRIEPETFVARGNVVAECGGKISDGTKGSPSVKVLCSRKILQEAAERKAWKKSERSDGEESVNSKDNRIPEDVVVMDYEQPHRKPPIHNWEP